VTLAESHSNRMNGLVKTRRRDGLDAARFHRLNQIGLCATLLAALGCLCSAWARADDSTVIDSSTATGTDAVPPRPVPLFNRWQEDWSVLADPRVPREPLDELKYLPLSAADPKMYLSLGANVRERFEFNDAVGFGTGANQSESYVISRTEIHADLHLGSQVEIFTQLQSDYAIDKAVHTPVDQDRLDLEQAFVLINEPLEQGQLALRLGRQQIGFDLQRFISIRDGPNVRQSYDAAWLEYTRGPWRITSLFSHPVQTRDGSPFDDYSGRSLSYGGLKVQYQFSDATNISVLYSHFIQDQVHFTSASGNESRDVFDMHAAGVEGPFDWDVEAMGQTGTIGAQQIRAWAFGSLGGYTMDCGWTPRLGLQFDGASGDRNPQDHVLNTFNPLFPNGYYVTLAGYTGYVNFIHLKSSVTLHPTQTLKLQLAVAGQWRESTADAVYTQPDIPVAGTAGLQGSYTGTYGQFRLDWTLTPKAAFAIEAVHFAVGNAVRQAGGHDGNFLGVEIRLAW